MAPLAKSLALAGSLFAAFSAAAPVDKRAIDIVYETTTTVVWTTIDVTTTVFGPKPTQEAPAAPPTTIISVDKVEPTQAPAPAPAPEPTQAEPEQTQPKPTTTVAPVVPTTTSVPQPIVPVEEPSTSETQPEPTTSVVVPPQPQPTSSTGGSSGGNSGGSSGGYNGACSKGSPCSGEVTFYDTATSMSAPSSCGTTNDGETENVLALPVGLMKDSDCGRTVTVRYGGVTTVGKVVDKCMGCDPTSIDLSRHFFGELASFAEGRLFDVEWWME